MDQQEARWSPLGALVRFALEQRLVVILGLLLLVLAGLVTNPFPWSPSWLPRSPVAVDALPDLSENQQIVFTDWPGRSPRDVEDQVTYPLTVQLMGLPGVRDVRSSSMFGFSTISVIFNEDVEFYWARSRILEKLNSLPAGTLPESVQPGLGPDATGLGQVYWYTLEGRDPHGRPVGGWDLHELRTIQDYYVRYGLLAAEGVSEVAGVGGFVREYHVEVDPTAARVAGVTMADVHRALRNSNLDVGAGTTELSGVEYVVRGVGQIAHTADIEAAVVRTGESFTPIRVADVATVTMGPAERRGALDRGGAEAVGGVVVVRQGANPLEAIAGMKEALRVLAPGMPVKALVDWTRTSPTEVEEFASRSGFQAFSEAGLYQEGWLRWLRSNPMEDWPGWVTTSQVTVEPFYDRTGLIQETLGTLSGALVQQLLVTVLVVLVMLVHLRASLVVSAMLPLAVLMTFVAMRAFGIGANVVALAGIAIAIGTIVDMGIIIGENVLRQLERAGPDRRPMDVIHRATAEVGGAVLTAIATTIISFLPVFAMTGAEGKLFTPLAWTKTFVLVAAAILAITVVPVALHLTLGRRRSAQPASPPSRRRRLLKILPLAVALVLVLARVWEPLGPGRSFLMNLLFVALMVGVVLGGFKLFEVRYERLLRWALAHKVQFLAIPGLLVLVGLNVWLGFDRLFGFVPRVAGVAGVEASLVRSIPPYSWGARLFPGLGREFMPALSEGSFLWMPTLMPHASMGEALDVMSLQNMAFQAIPEVESVVGKIGRAESALDPAPLSMIETVINYHPEYATDHAGRRLRYAFDEEAGVHARDSEGRPIPHRGGRPLRLWRDHISSPVDIWGEIVEAGRVTGSTSAPMLQPIETRLVMLQTGMRAPMGLKVRGPDLETLERAALDLEELLRLLPTIDPDTVSAERVVAKPYIELHVDRAAAGRYGLTVVDVQGAIEMAIGGKAATTTVEGRERYKVKVRYPRELRSDPESMAAVLVGAPGGLQVPLGEVARVEYVRGPEMIRSENTFPVAYVTFGGAPGVAEVDVVEDARAHIQGEMEAGRFSLPGGVSFTFAGSYENQLHAARTLRLVLPLSLATIFLVLYLLFRNTVSTVIVFSGIAVAWAGGFILIWLLGQPWFGDVDLLGVNLRELFQAGQMNLSVAVWVGFLALFGVAVDDGVVMMTWLRQGVVGRHLRDVQEVREAVVKAGLRRVRPCLMTSATTILALLPVLTATGRGSDVMIPMAVPTVGGLSLVLLGMFTVPVLFAWVEERRVLKL